MARVITFSEGEVLIGQGNPRDTVAYLVISGWLQIHRCYADKPPSIMRVGPGEIVGELGLAGMVSKRTATVTALTDGEVEVIDRGTLIRLVNGPGSRLTPLLSALFLRLQSLLRDEEDETGDRRQGDSVRAELDGLNQASRQSLCNEIQNITHLPWVFGAYVPPTSVSDIFRDHIHQDVILINTSHALREEHLRIEAGEDGTLQLRIMQPGDYCEIDEQRIGRGDGGLFPLSAGVHLLRFGDAREPYEFSLRVFQ